MGKPFHILPAEHGVFLAVRPAEDAPHLRVLRLAHHDEGNSRAAGLPGHVVNAGDEGAGRVHDLAALSGKRVVGGAIHAVRADHRPNAVGNFFQRVHGHDAHPPQALHDLRAVDNRPQGDGGRGLFGGSHRAPDAEAEARVRRQDHFDGDSLLTRSKGFRAKPYTCRNFAIPIFSRLFGKFLQADCDLMYI